MSLAALLLLSVALAQDVPPAREVASAPPLEREERLERGLATIHALHLRADLEFLAADALAGRDTPSPGLAVAGLFLRARLERLGFTPASEGSWFAPYSLEDRTLDVERSGVWLRSPGGELRLAFGEDYFFSRTSHVFDSDVRAPAVSVGAGSRDEFESAELEGAWAILFDQGSSTRRATRYAEAAGAAGVVLVENLEVSKPFARRYRSQTRIALEPRISYPLVASRGAPDEPPLLLLSALAGGKLLGLSDAAEAGGVPPAGTALGVELHEVRGVGGDDIVVNNVAGLWPGSDPELRHEVIVVSAHYDHVGTSDGEIYNGADDNASGTTGLLGIAQALAAYGPLRRSVLLLWLSGEEKGLWGSHAWAKAPVLPAGFTPVADINIDMIGRTEPAELYVTPSRDHGSYNALARAAYELSSLEGFPTLASQDEDWSRSDHFNFDRLLEIPVVFLSAGEHADYHRPTDTADKIDFDKLARITRLVVRMLDRIQDDPLERAGG